MSTCARCGAVFACAMADGARDGEPCWCTRLPAVLPVPDADSRAGCWCPACLEQHIALRQAPSPGTTSGG